VSVVWTAWCLVTLSLSSAATCTPQSDSFEIRSRDITRGLFQRAIADAASLRPVVAMGGGRTKIADEDFGARLRGRAAAAGAFSLTRSFTPIFLHLAPTCRHRHLHDLQSSMRLPRPSWFELAETSLLPAPERTNYTTCRGSGVHVAR
jgi:hypothetical protein